MTVSGFLSKTFDIFSDPANQDICSWGANGDTIHVKKIDLFSKTILPKYFKHSNFQSFVRQLNMYDFHKTVQDPGNGEFTHVNFRKNRPDLLPLIKRKAHSKNELRSKQQQQLQAAGEFGGRGGLDDDGKLSSPDALFVMSALEQEQMKQKRIRDDFEWRLSQLEAQKARIYELEAQQGRLAGENYMLKQLLQESRAQQNQLQGKMEGVLKLMYHAFVNSGSNNLPAISNGIPESKLLEFCNFLNLSSPPLLKLESGERVEDGKRIEQFGNNGSVTNLNEGDLLDCDDINNYLDNGDMSNDLISPSTNENRAEQGDHKRVNAQIGRLESEQARKVRKLDEAAATDDGSPKFQKIISFDSLAESIVPNQLRPPLSTTTGSNTKAGSNGIAGGDVSMPLGGSMLSRQHSLELPPAGHDISGGYHYTPLSNAPSIRKLNPKTQGGEEWDGKDAKSQWQPQLRPPTMTRQDSDDSLGIPLGHIDSMDSTLASLLDISDEQNNE